MSNDEFIYSTAVAAGMPPVLATIIVAQARHETGNYTSRFFTIGKNAFGYSYYAGSKWQLDEGGPDADNGIPIAQYSSVYNSVHELTDWIKRRQAEGKFPANLAEINTPDKYAQLLKSAGYYQASLADYSAALVAWLQSIGNLSAGAYAGTAIILIIALGLILYRKKIFK